MLAFAIPSVLLMLLTAPGTCELGFLSLSGVVRKKRLQPAAANWVRRLTIVIPAHNEAALIGRCLVSLANCWAPSAIEVGIVVVADNCSDDTAEIAQKLGAQVFSRSEPDRAGKGFALQHAFSRLLTEGIDAVLVVDADTVVEPNLLVEMARWLNAGADGVQARYLVLNPADSVRTRIMNLALMAFNVLRPRGRARWGLSVGILGNGFALSRSTLQSVEYNAESIVEDLEYHIRLVRHGRRIAFADNTTVRADMPTSNASAATQRARWDGGRLGIAARTIPGLAREIGQGNLSLIEPFFDLLLLPLAFHVLILVLLITIPFRPGRLWALCSLSIIIFHVGAAFFVGGGGINELAGLVAAPWYVAWKLAGVQKTLKSARRDTEWIRTQRAVDN